MAKKYAALANTIKIEDITSKKLNREILHKLKNNDESFDKLYIIDGDSGDGDDYVPDDGEDIGWLGYFIGQNTKLQELNFYITMNYEPFYKEISRNKSINRIKFREIYVTDLLHEHFFRMLAPFFKSNNNLTKISVEDCEFGIEGARGARHLSLAIGNCGKSLKEFTISDNEMVNAQVVDIITGLSMHPQLEQLSFERMNIGRLECTALSTLLRCTTTQLQKLNLRGNNIDDESIEVLVDAFVSSNMLKELKLGQNPSITIDGWKSVATLLELPDTKLETLHISNSNIGNEGVLVFANALTNNSTLIQLDLMYNYSITAEGWASFSKLLCDTSTVNNTYLSNHTLTHLGSIEGEPAVVGTSLLFNNMEDKQQVAMVKILQHHSHFNMQPFFEWEFKVLPLIITWFKKAVSCKAVEYESRNYRAPFGDCKEKTKRMKLAAVYDYIREFPMLYVEPMTKQEIAKYTAMEEQLQGDDLKEIQKCKAHAMRRL